MSDWTRSASKLLLWPPAGIQPLRAPVSSWVKSEPHFGVEKFYVDIKCPTSERSFIQTGSQRETEFNSTGCNEGILMNYLEGCGQHSGDGVQVAAEGERGRCPVTIAQRELDPAPAGMPVGSRKRTSALLSTPHPFCLKVVRPCPWVAGLGCPRVGVRSAGSPPPA